jgi:hypothetical protein
MALVLVEPERSLRTQGRVARPARCTTGRDGSVRTAAMADIWSATAPPTDSSDRRGAVMLASRRGGDRYALCWGAGSLRLVTGSVAFDVQRHRALDCVTFPL